MYEEIKSLSFSEVLMNIDEGGCVEEIQEKLKIVAKAVSEAGNAGSLTIKLSLASEGQGKQIVVKETVTAGMPKRPAGISLFFATEEGGLTRLNPDQLSFAQLREKNAEVGE